MNVCGWILLLWFIGIINLLCVVRRLWVVIQVICRIVQDGRWQCFCVEFLLPLGEDLLDGLWLCERVVSGLCPRLIGRKRDDARNLLGPA